VNEEERNYPGLITSILYLWDWFGSPEGNHSASPVRWLVPGLDLKLGPSEHEASVYRDIRRSTVVYGLLNEIVMTS